MWRMTNKQINKQTRRSNRVTAKKGGKKKKLQVLHPQATGKTFCCESSERLEWKERCCVVRLSFSPECCSVHSAATAASAGSRNRRIRRSTAERTVEAPHTGPDYEWKTGNAPPPLHTVADNHLASAYLLSISRHQPWSDSRGRHHIKRD